MPTFLSLHKTEMHPGGAGNMGTSQIPAMARTFSRVVLRHNSLPRRAKIPELPGVFQSQFAFHMSEGFFYCINRVDVIENT